ncbi:hypothetical protein [uncultured Tateyamaria sp.]|uniref:hypothetical protein n=1 Tax=uncultured Tateyamaria sp. TaxID=455651 RepID=UPI002609605A|nr:hypothetical protein [uncultured Tateyamaria sp.]
MKEPITIQPSRFRVASHEIIFCCIALVWPLIYVVDIHWAGHINPFSKLMFAVFGVAGLGWAIFSSRRIWRIFQSKRAWRATIGNGRLRWESGIPSMGLPLDIALADIATAIQVKTFKTVIGSDGEYTELDEFYELRLTDGRGLSFDRETVGIYPDRVFKALEKHGVTYERWLQNTTKHSTNHARVRVD